MGVKPSAIERVITATQVGAGPDFSGSARESQLDVSLTDLVHEGVRIHPEADQIDPQYDIPAQRHGVLTEVVLHDGEPCSVLSAVDLDDESEAFPPDIEIDPPAGPVTKHLAARFGQVAGSAQTSKVQLPQRLDSVTQVVDDLLDEATMTPRRHGLGCLHQPSRGDNALLNDHAEDERRLPTGDRPVRSADRSYVRTNAWNSHAEDLVLPRANRVSSHPDDLVGPAAMRDRDMDHVVVEVLESLSLESRDTVEGGDSAPTSQMARQRNASVDRSLVCMATVW